jgi:hypothetical protein
MVESSVRVVKLDPFVSRAVGRASPGYFTNYDWVRIGATPTYVRINKQYRYKD